MSGQWTILWTDIAVYILISILSVYILWLSRHPLIRQKWHQLLKKPINFAAFFVLCLYFIVTVADSIHFQQKNGKLESFLDMVVLSDIIQNETTYSAPFALYAYEKITITSPEGEIKRELPRLEHAGKHLDDIQSAKEDIKNRLSKHLGMALLISLIIVVPLYQPILKRGWPIKTVFFLFFITGFISFSVFDLMQDYHLLGTGKVGQDIFYESIKGIRTAVVIGTLTTFSILPFAIPLGLTAGYLKGWVDDFIQYLYTTLSAIPGVLLIAAIVLMLQVYMADKAHWFSSSAQRADARLLILCLVLGATSWTGLCRLLRAEVLKLSTLEFVQAAKILGTKSHRIVFKHLLPNVMHIVLISVALDFSGFVLAEAVLSYVGVGVDPATYSWGSMINAARMELSRSPMVWWSLISAFAFMFILVLAANLFADAIRDTFDPKLSQG